MFTSITPGSGRHLEHLDSRIEGQCVALQHYRHAEMSGRVFDRRHEIQIVGNILDRRHEYEQLAVARLYAECRTCDPCRRLAFLRRLRAFRCRLPIVSHGRRGEKVRPARGLSGSTSRFANGSGSKEYRTSSGLVQGRESSGRRYPIGESPGIRNICSDARNQGWLVQRGMPCLVAIRRSGST